MAEPSAFDLIVIGVIAIIACFGGMILLMKTTQWANDYSNK